MTRYPVPSSRTAARTAARVTIYDAFCALATPFVAFWLRDPGLLASDNLGTLAIYCGLACVFTLSALRYFRAGQGLSRYFSLPDAIRIIKAALVAVVLTAAVAFTLTRLSSVPRSIPAIHFFVLASALAGGRLVRRARYGYKGTSRTVVERPAENVLVIGANRLGWSYTRILASFGHGHHKVVGFLDNERGAQGRSISGYPILGKLSALQTVIEEFALHGVVVHRVVVAGPASPDNETLWATFRGVCDERQIRLEFLAERLGLIDDEDESGEELLPAAPTEWADLRAGGFWLAKRSFDILVSGSVLLITFPLFFVLAAVVFFDSGAPITFWQQRTGRDRRPIFVYKMRTLRPPFTPSGDPIPEDERLSTVGRFLRAVRLDEYPQLYNILIGDMSIIGPRPLLPIDQPEGDSFRLAVRPGLTGWAQVHGGKLITPEEKNALDEWYIRNASVRLEAKILLLTVRALFMGDRRNEAEIEKVLDTARAAESEK